MINAYSPSYPCKVISSFFDNYFGEHKYALIKKITLRYLKADSKEEIDIERMLILFHLVFSIHPSKMKGNIHKFFNFAFDRYPSAKLKEFIDKFNLEEEFSWINLCIDNLTKLDQEEAFTLFLLMSVKLSFIFGYPIVIPTNLIEVNKGINDKQIRHYFNISFLTSLLKKEKLDLKKAFTSYILSKEEEYKKLGIKEIYLYGSIADEEYHNLSDFDLVIRYEDSLSFEKKNMIDRKIKEDLFLRFKRETDIINYHDFIQIRDIEKTTKLF